MALHSSTLAWKIPWMEEPGGLQSTGLLRVAHDWATSLSLFTFMHWRRKWQPTPVFFPGESQGRGSLVGWCLWGRTELDMMKRLSSSSIDTWYQTSYMFFHSYFFFLKLKSFVHLLSFVLVLSLESSLYILHTVTLSDVRCANIFSQSVAYFLKLILKNVPL